MKTNLFLLVAVLLLCLQVVGCGRTLTMEEARQFSDAELYQKIQDHVKSLAIRKKERHVANYRTLMAVAAERNPEWAANQPDAVATAPNTTILGRFFKRIEPAVAPTIALGIIGASAYMAAKNGSTGSSGGYSMYQPNYQGCCSYHLGISRDFLGRAQCHFTAKVLCNDGQPSPTCWCY